MHLFTYADESYYIHCTHGVFIHCDITCVLYMVTQTYVLSMVTQQVFHLQLHLVCFIHSDTSCVSSMVTHRVLHLWVHIDLSSNIRQRQRVFHLRWHNVCFIYGKEAFLSLIVKCFLSPCPPSASPWPLYGDTTCDSPIVTVFHLWGHSMRFSYWDTTCVSVMMIKRVFQYWWHNVCFIYESNAWFIYGDATCVSFMVTQRVL